MPEVLSPALDRMVPFTLDTTAAIPNRVLAESRAEAEAIGYSQGWARGLRDAHQARADEAQRAKDVITEAAARHDSQLRSAHAALGQAVAQLSVRAAVGATDIELVIAKAAVQIATAILGTELSNPEIASATALARILALAPESDSLSIRLNPADLAALKSGAETEQASELAARGVVLIADPTVASGDALATDGATLIDARISEAVVRLHRHLESLGSESR